jgi:hypothetical protein
VVRRNAHGDLWTSKSGPSGSYFAFGLLRDITSNTFDMVCIRKVTDYGPERMHGQTQRSWRLMDLEIRSIGQLLRLWLPTRDNVEHFRLVCIRKVTDYGPERMHGQTQRSWRLMDLEIRSIGQLLRLWLPTRDNVEHFRLVCIRKVTDYGPERMRGQT